jgi:hypothetical protein
LTFGTRLPLSDLQTRVRIKRWLLKGVAIPDDDPAGKLLHMADNLRHYESEDEAVVDAEAAAIQG